MSKLTKGQKDLFWILESGIKVTALEEGGAVAQMREGDYRRFQDKTIMPLFEKGWVRTGYPNNDEISIVQEKKHEWKGGPRVIDRETIVEVLASKLSAIHSNRGIEVEGIGEAADAIIELFSETETDRIISEFSVLVNSELPRCDTTGLIKLTEELASIMAENLSQTTGRPWEARPCAHCKRSHLFDKETEDENVS